MQRWQRANGRWPTDGAVWPHAAAVLLSAVMMLETLLRVDGTGPRLLAALLLGVCTTAPLALAYRFPLAAALITTAALAVSVQLSATWTGAGVAAMLAAWLLLAWRRLRRARFRARERDASRRRFENTLAELTARGERARIARDLHDVVAHHISMISVQAETARLTTPGMPPDGARRLQDIGETARAALTEMRRLLGVLREDAGAEPTRAPQPGMAQLLELVDEARAAAGTHARLIIRGRAVPMDPGVELTAYRVVQEALSNARKYAPGAAVDVAVDYGEDGVRVRVRDNGPGPPTTAGRHGHGLLGMRERVSAVGGRLRTAAPPTGGFLVEAALPIPVRDETRVPR